MRLGVCLIMVSVCGACSGAGTRPEDMSQAAHEQTAEQHEESAGHSRIHSVGGPPGRGFAVVEHDWPRFHEQLAEAHEQAGEELLQRQAAACEGIPEAEIDVCPVSDVEIDVASVEGGVEITLPAGGLSAEDLARRAQCHHARMAVEGLENFPGCVLAVRDITVTSRLADDGRPVLIVKTADAASVDQLRSRATACLHDALPAGGTTP